MEKKAKHMEFIQNTIHRMASNSFSLKGWAVTLVAGIFALASKDTDKMYFLVAYIPIIAFWGLDAYYLYQEKRFRALYDIVRISDEADIDFSMSTTRVGESKDICYFQCFVSHSTIAFYLPLAIATAGIIILTHLI